MSSEVLIDVQAHTNLSLIPEIKRVYSYDRGYPVKTRCGPFGACLK